MILNGIIIDPDTIFISNCFGQFRVTFSERKHIFPIGLYADRAMAEEIVKRLKLIGAAERADVARIESAAEITLKNRADREARNAKHRRDADSTKEGAPA